MVTSETHVQWSVLKRLIKNVARTNTDLEALIRKRNRELSMH